MKEVKESTGNEVSQKLTEEQKDIIFTVHAHTPQGVIDRLVALVENESKEEI